MRREGSRDLWKKGPSFTPGTPVSVQLHIKTRQAKATALRDHLIFPKWARGQQWSEPFGPSGVFPDCFCTKAPLVQIGDGVTGFTVYAFFTFYFILFYFILFYFICLFRTALTAYGDSQARGPIGAVAASLYQSHSNAGSEPRLQPAPQLMATSDH